MIYFFLISTPVWQAVLYILDYVLKFQMLRVKFNHNSTPSSQGWGLKVQKFCFPDTRRHFHMWNDSGYNYMHKTRTRLIQTNSNCELRTSTTSFCSWFGDGKIIFLGIWTMHITLVTTDGDLSEKCLLQGYTFEYFIPIMCWCLGRCIRLWQCWKKNITRGRFW